MRCGAAGRARGPWEVRALIDASIAFTGYSSWLIIAAQGWLWLTVVVFAAMVVVLIDLTYLLVRRADELTCPAWLRRLAVVTFGLYLGWGSVAVFANVAAALIRSGWSATATGWQAAVLVAATISAVLLTTLLRGTPGYVAAVLWALIAVAVGAANRGSAVLTGAAAAATVVIAITAAIAVGIRRQRS